ncbi:MAG: permease-like cell division protein FtsX [Desulfobacterales bacterium]|nr:permease-like cell division protein FtsX [Desulfobacterales bacterium]MDD4071688.1 permease-like cell division protein FtsX [Desulfobacterales bacterium]MDD4391408.1 permease-like cell division protein FtsX [Desulfobacterales bacterium]
MMILFIKRAFRDMIQNPFLNAITVTTIAFSILIISAFTLFSVNAQGFMNSWKQGFHMMVYLKPAVTEANISAAQSSIEAIGGVNSVRFISKEAALVQMKEQMIHQASFFDGLTENPLPDAFEIHISDALQSDHPVETIATLIESFDPVEKVEYGREWIERVFHVFHLVRLAGYAMGGLFFMAAAFIVANTMRLGLYSKAGEIEIMRLVGATDRFIKTPFYIQAVIHGAGGAVLGVCALYAVYGYLTGQIDSNLSAGLFHIRFLPLNHIIAIFTGSMGAGWLGCYFSLKQFLNA